MLIGLLQMLLMNRKGYNNEPLYQKNKRVRFKSH